LLSDTTQDSVKCSLERLQTDRIDIVLVHSNGDDETIIKKYGTLEVLKELKQAGLIRAFGMSTKTLAGGLLAAECSDIVMVSYNLEYTNEEPILDYCHTHQKGVFIKKAFGSGHLLLKDDDMLQKSFNFIFAHPGVTSVIIGTINPDHLRANAEALARRS